MTDERNKDVIELARTADDVERIHKAGKLVALIGIENGYAIGGRLELLKMYYDLGARYLGLAYNGENDLADGGLSEGFMPGPQTPEHHGLSDLGRAVVAECNRLGIMVDVAHSSEDVQLQAAKLSKAPIIDSHTGVDAIEDSPRNLDDDALSAIAKTGGVVQIFAWDSFIKAVPKEKLEALAGLRSNSRSARGIFRQTSTTMSGTDIRPSSRRSMPNGRVRALRTWSTTSTMRLRSSASIMSALPRTSAAGQGIKGWMNVAETPNVTAELSAARLQPGGYHQDVGWQYFAGHARGRARRPRRSRPRPADPGNMGPLDRPAGCPSLQHSLRLFQGKLGSQISHPATSIKDFTHAL